MKGYPKFIAVKQDYINLLSMPEYQEQALKDLQSLYDMDDEKATRVISLSEEEINESELLEIKSKAVGSKFKHGNAEIEVIENPMPFWKIKGFKNRAEVKKLLEVRHG